MISLLDIRARIADGTLSAADAVRAARERIAARDSRIGAVLRTAPEAAVSDRGPLAGIAVGIKDIIDTADMATECGSAIHAGWRPRADAAIVSRLRALGAVPLALAHGAGAEARIQIGWVIVGGMSFGTLLTLFVVPAVYSLFGRSAAVPSEAAVVAFPKAAE